MMMTIDAHQHFWQISRGDYGWLTPKLGELYRDYLPRDLQPLIRQNGVTSTIVVQAAPTVDESLFLLDLASEHAFIAGVVGWVQFDAPDAIEQLKKLHERSCDYLVGVRPMLQELEDPHWVGRRDLDPVFDEIARLGLAFDALVKPKNYATLLQRIRRYPDVRFVIDHCGKPDIAAGVYQEWTGVIDTIASFDNTFCKLSGLATEAGSGDSDVLRRYADKVLEAFSPYRVMWGSDWPVMTLATDYSEWRRFIDAVIGNCSDEERAAVLGGVACRVYGL